MRAHHSSGMELKLLQQEAKELRRGLRSIKDILPRSSSQKPEPTVETSEEDVDDTQKPSDDVSLHQVVMEAAEIIADLLPDDQNASEDSDNSDSRYEYEPEDEMDVTQDEPNQEPSEQWNEDASVHVAGKEHHKDEELNVEHHKDGELNVDTDKDSAEDPSFCVAEPAAEPPAEPAAEPPAAEPVAESQRERAAATAENFNMTDNASADSGADADANPPVPESNSLNDLAGLVPYFEEVSEPVADLQADRSTAIPEGVAMPDDVAAVDGAGSDANDPAAPSLRNLYGWGAFVLEFSDGW